MNRTNNGRGSLPWLMWSLGALFYCYGFFQRVAPSVMVEDLMRDFAVGAAITGTLSSLYFYTYAGLQIPIGLMLDKYGPRRMLTIAGLLGAAGAFAFAASGTLMPAYLGRALIGIGAAVSWVGTLKLASAWFPPNRFALLTGLTMALGMTGAVGGQVPLAAAVAAFGWRGTMIGAAALAGLLALAVWAIVRDTPKDAGPRANPATDRPEGHGVLSGLTMAMAEPQTWWTALFGALLTAPMLSFAGLWGVPYMMEAYDLPRPAAATATSLMLIGWGIGSPLVGWVTDRVGRRRPPMLVTSSASLALTLAWLYGGLPLWLVYGLLFLTGLCAGGMILTFATAREHNPLWAAGSALALVNMGVMSTGAVFQPLIGWALDLQWDGTIIDGARVYSDAAYAVALAVLPACHILSLIGALKVRETHCTPQK